MEKKNFIKLLLASGALSSFALPIFAFAQTQITIATSVPGTYGPTAGNGGIGAFIANFYQFGLVIAGVLAFGVIVYGGIKYMTSAGNPSKQSEGKEWIEAALLGLILLAAAYFILRVVNPQLTDLTLPPLSPANVATTQTTGGGAPTTGGQTTAGTGCAGGGICAVLPNCTPSSHTSCGGAPAMATVLSCVNNIDPNYAVNEGYPPTPPGTQHSDPGHNTGCAIDVHVSSCAAGAAFMSAAQSCGASKVLNEYSNCGGTTYTHTTGGNIHIDAPKGQGGC